MLLNVSIFKCFSKKILYISEANYYFGIKDSFRIKTGNYQLSEEEIIHIAKENNEDAYKDLSSKKIVNFIENTALYNFEEFVNASSQGQFTLCLHPSRKCNLNCKYCFREADYLGKDQLTFAVAKAAIDFLVDQYAPYASKYVVDLSGSGEPMLEFDLIRQIVEYCKQKRNEICKNIEVMFCTNFTLLTPEMVDYLDNEAIIILGTSLDGNQLINDTNRVYSNGNGTYEDVIKGLKMFKNKKIGLAVTLTPINQDVDLIYEHLYQLPNVDCVSMSFIRSFDDSQYGIENFDPEYLLNRYERLCEKMYDNICNGNIDYIMKLLNGTDVFGSYILQSIIKSTNRFYKCDAGKNRIAVNSVGDIYACSVTMGNNEFCIGNINSGINITKQKKFFVSPILSQQECKNCLVAHRCGGECSANSYFKNNNIDTPINKMCEIKMGLIKMSMAFVEKIKETNIQTFSDLLNLFFRIQTYSVTDSSIWGIMHYLKLKGYSPNYSEISQNLDFTLNGVIPQNIIRCLNDYNRNISAYQIDSVTEINKTKLPAICFVNQQQTYGYQYILVTDTFDGQITCLEPSTNSFCYMSIEDFLSNVSNVFIF